MSPSSVSEHGHGMAGRYLDSGLTVAVWESQQGQGGRSDCIAGARGPIRRPMLPTAGAIVTMVADDEASRGGVARKDGAAETAKQAPLAIECSTVSYQHALDPWARSAAHAVSSTSIARSPACPERAAGGKLDAGWSAAEPAD